MRILHTSDWHLGHTLHDRDREFEHAIFLDWLLDVLGRYSVDALIVAGDIFDSANPSASAQALWYRFLARARGQYPDRDVVVIGGNHDSPSRLDAPDPILSAFGIHVVGGFPRGDIERALVPLKNHAWVAAVPFLRAGDLDADASPVEGVRAVYARVLAEARARRQPGQAIIATGHCYMSGTRLSEQSERKILGGNQHALPADIFPDEVAYAALGHLHLAQAVERDNVRYCGSPIPLSLEEAGYPHQVLLVDIEGEQFVSARPLHVPRAVEIIRVPAEGAAPLEEILPWLRALPEIGDLEERRRPYLHVEIALPKPRVSLRQELEDALAGKAARLVRWQARYAGEGGALADERPGASLRDLRPEDVFRMRYQRAYPDAPSDELMTAFHELVLEAHA
ncbi:MAG: exonuclease subunit SbcD [Armatimonadetes bacterium]|nr:exonuclease subunit SbcD [Armatimonadota bacterium]